MGKQFKMIIDDMCFPSFILDKNHDIVSQNTAFKKTFKNEEILPDLVMKAATLLKEDAQPGQVFEFEGHQHWISLIADNKNNDLFYFMVKPVDEFGQYFKVFAPVQAMERDFLSILESLHDDFVITDETGVIRTVLPNFESFYGIPAEEVLGKTVYELESRQILNPSIVARAIKSGKKETLLQMTVTGKYLICTAIPILDPQGKVTKIVSFSRDVTQYEELKKQYAKLEGTIEYYSSEISRLKEQQAESPTVLIGESPEIRRTMGTINRIAQFDTNVLLTGESGVGKTIYARAIHDKSSRSSKPFVELNCGSIPENLFESELFGYEKGAFTGASETGKIGWIEKADGGTLFLDEIADMPMTMQVKLLKTLDNKRITRVGGTDEIKVDFRLIAATNKDIQQLIKEGKFREDLFFRINVMLIQIPPLRERQDDIFPLIRYFMEKNQQKYSIEKGITSSAIDALVQYSWPGNIRELENLVERLILSVEEYMITVDDLPAYVQPVQPSFSAPDIEGSDQTLPDYLAEIERKVILDTYEKYHSTTKVAKALGISQPSVSVKLKKYAEEDEDK